MVGQATRGRAVTVAWVRDGDRSGPDGALGRPGPWAPVGAAIVESGAGRPPPKQRTTGTGASGRRRYSDRDLLCAYGQGRCRRLPHEAGQEAKAGAIRRNVDGARHGLPERSGASLRALLREGVTRSGPTNARAERVPPPREATPRATAGGGGRPRSPRRVRRASWPAARRRGTRPPSAAQSALRTQLAERGEHQPLHAPHAAAPAAAASCAAGPRSTRTVARSCAPSDSVTYSGVIRRHAGLEVPLASQPPAARAAARARTSPDRAGSRASAMPRVHRGGDPPSLVHGAGDRALALEVRRVDHAHEPEVEEADAAVVEEQVVARVRIGVDAAEAGSACRRRTGRRSRRSGCARRPGTCASSNRRPVNHLGDEDATARQRG